MTTPWVIAIFATMALLVFGVVTNVYGNPATREGRRRLRTGNEDLWPETPRARSLWAQLDHKTRNRLQQAAHHCEVGQSGDEAIVLAWLQGREHAERARERAWYVIPVIGDTQLIHDLRYRRARRLNLQRARDEGVLPPRH